MRFVIYGGIGAVSYVISCFFRGPVATSFGVGNVDSTFLIRLIFGGIAYVACFVLLWVTASKFVPEFGTGERKGKRK